MHLWHAFRGLKQKEVQVVQAWWWGNRKSCWGTGTEKEKSSFIENMQCCRLPGMAGVQCRHQPNRPQPFTAMHEPDPGPFPSSSQPFKACLFKVQILISPVSMWWIERREEDEDRERWDERDRRRRHTERKGEERRGGDRQWWWQWGWWGKVCVYYIHTGSTG